MPLSNTTQEILSSSPYWDDFREDKNFHRVLIKPRLPVQTRELNQIQSMLQNQVEQLGSGIYREGAAVTGGQQTFANNVLALQVVKKDTVDISNFYNSNTAQGVLVRGLTSYAEALVTQVYSTASSEYASIIIAPITSTSFQADEDVVFLDPTTDPASTIASMTVAPAADALKNASIFSVETGTFFLRGHLVRVNKQTVVLAVGDTLVSRRIGLEPTESIVTYADDATLLDPALSTTNYAAPGADRLKLQGILSTRTLFQGETPALNADDNFIEIARVVAGVLQPREERLERDFVEDTLARRTYDESGDYVIRPFRLISKDHNPPLSVPNITGYVTSGTSNATAQIIQGANIVSTIVNSNGTTSNVTTLFQSEIAVGDVLVVRNEQREVTSILSNTVLTVNGAYTESFTDEIATLISPNKLNLELDAGKAYVRGYEFETYGTTKLAADRARTVETVDNGYIGTGYGPYLYVVRGATSNTGHGLYDTSRMQLTDLHCLPYNNVINVTATSYAATKIGTARVRAFTYHSGNGDANTIYKAYLVGAEFLTKTFAVSAAANSDTQLTSNVTNSAITINSTAKTIQLRQNTSTTNASILACGNGAYIGATIQLQTILGQQLNYAVTNSTYTSPAANVYIQTLTLDADDNLAKVNTTANVTLIFSDKCIRGLANGNTMTVGATVDSSSKVDGVSTGNTIMGGSTSTGLLYRYRQGFVNVASITDESYSVLRYLTSVSGTGSPAVYTIDISSYATWEVPYPQSSGVEEYLVASLSSNGATISLKDATASIVSQTLTLTIPVSDIPGGAAASIDLYVPSTVTNATAVTKTLTVANTSLSNVAVSSGNLITNATNGHFAVNVINASSSNIVGLGIADVYAIQKVYAVTHANTIATNTNAVVDVTDRYTLDNGQRDWCYDHASIVLKPGYTHYTTNCTQLLVMADVFTHSTITGNAGYFNAQSYAGFAPEDIPRFVNPKTGIALDLWHYVDFRPVRQANAVYANTATNPYNSADTTFNQCMLPLPTGTYTADYQYYLPRIDRVILSKEKTLRVIQGTPARQPVPPADDVDGITLYLVSYPPYTANAELLNIVPFEYKRYTMRDIGKLERRIENLEYYASLSTLDLQALNTPEYDDNDIERFKNGILTDSFANQAIANFKNTDTKISVDTRNKEMRPSFDMDQYNFEVNLNTSTKVEGLGKLSGKNLGIMSLPFTTTPFVTQGLASTSVNINPFNVVSWIGSLSLLPPSDTWIDVITKPDVTINRYNENDGLQAGTRAIHTEWNTWETVVMGESTVSMSELYAGRMEGATDPDNPHPADNPGGVRDQALQDIIMTTPSTHTQMRQATVTMQKVSFHMEQLGERILDTSIAPKMRGVVVDVVAEGLLPGADLRATFDDIDVTAFVQRANEIYLANSAVASTFRVGDALTSNASGIARIVGINANILRVVDANGQFSGKTISLSKTLHPHTPETDITRTANAAVQTYVHWHGVASAVGNTGGGTFTITLDAGAPSTDIHGYVGKTIYFSDGGYLSQVNLVTDATTSYTTAVAGAKGVITAYSGGVATVSVASEFQSAFAAQASSYTTANPIRYSIGSLRAESTSAEEEVWRQDVQDNESVSPEAVEPGIFYGTFRVPGYRVLSAADQTRYLSSQLLFNTGRRTFKLENISSDTESYARSTFAATGSTVTKQREFIRTREVQTWTETSPAQLVATYNAESRQILETKIRGYIDPLAQTFMVVGDRFPYGAFVTHIDLFFAKKGSSGLPVTVQLRPTVNGFPSADLVLAEGRVRGADINVVAEGVTPQIGNSAHYTRIYFDQPTHLSPNVEYAIVVMANTQEYELFVAEVGQRVVGSTSIIAEQALGGVLFKSQNARTWTPEQTQDLMFELHRAEFDMTEGYVEFQVSNSDFTYVPPFQYDVLEINTGHVEFEPTRPFTQLNFSATNLSNTLTEYPLTPGINLILPERKQVRTGNGGSLLVQATIRTGNSHVSPIFDIHRMSAVAVKNRIDNGQLYGNGFAVTQGVPLAPVGNAASNSYVLTITGGNGSGAVIYANTNSTGFVTSFYVSNAGSGYTETPTIAFPSANTGDYTTAPTLTYIGETSPSSGIAGEQKARYITRTVTLAEGFDASDVKVYLSATRSQADNIDVYYKVLATGDPQQFDDKSWTLMTLKTGQDTLYSTATSQFREYEYRTTENKASYTYSGTTYNRFHTFAIKVVLRSTNTTTVPRVRNLRVVALDE